MVDALVAAVRAAYPRLSHRYYALKARWFGKKRLAALGPQRAAAARSPTRTIGWSEAQPTVLTAYGAFSPKMAAIAERFFKNNWIDAPVRPGKAPGAFAHPTVPSAHPYVLLNYQGKPRDVMTLAHELGHGVHQVLAAPNGALMAPTPLTLGRDRERVRRDAHLQEVARRDADKKQRKAMLAAKVEDMINTVVRQIAFYTLRAQRPHRTAQAASSPPSSSATLWLEVQRESLGPAIELKPGLRDLLGLYPALRPFAVLRLRLCVRRLPGELALRGLRAGDRGLRRALSRNAGGRRHQAPFRTARPVRPRRPRSRRSGRAAWA